VTSYARFDGATLPRAVGSDLDTGSRVSDGRAGHLCFGPYATLDPGTYVAGYYVQKLPGSARGQIDFDVFVSGREVLAHRTVSTDTLFEDTQAFLTVEFTVEERAERTEVRLYVHHGVLIEISELIIFSTRPRNWGGK
jgi:hypothetical protein